MNSLVDIHDEPKVSRRLWPKSSSTAEAGFVYLVKASRVSQATTCEWEQYIYLSDAAWQKFVKALDEPPREHERMKRLLNEPSILDED